MSTYIPVQLRQEIRTLDKDRCAYCQSAEALMGVTFEIEHIIPVSMGGETHLHNLCLSCPTCNRHKANRIKVHDSENVADIPLFHPRKQAWSEHFIWSDDATTLIGLSSIGRITIRALHINRPGIIRLRQYWVALNLHPPINEEG
jgi:hypothetical protein